ncbi:Bet v I type allergen protein [Dioscorea alata]|uniref:Bet v I type allergen protein n=1 Tax=Dioscorea alata TaxID=55571 RepID=A0ACB7VPV5_DIOAL|nr:Bet v I type allergen protein [Dioscorea alata]
MVAGSFTHETTSSVAPDRLWKAAILDHELIPKLCAEQIASLELLEGDGGVGTITKLTLTPAANAPFSYVKEKVDVLDHENKVYKYSSVEGGLLGVRFNSCSFEIKFAPSHEGGTIGKLTCHYDTTDDTPVGEEEKGQILTGLLGMLNAVEAYLVANPTAFA